MRTTVENEEMNMVNGGIVLDSKYYHEGCGGNLWHANNVFTKTKCSNCGMKHYQDTKFTNVIYQDVNTGEFYWYIRNGKRVGCDEELYKGDTSIYN